jgi:hypothetical protein
MRRHIIIFASTLCIGFAFEACKHHPEIIDDNGGNGGGNGGTDTLIIENPDPCSPDTTYFVNTIQPLLNSMCAVPECHDAITAEDGVMLTDYAHIMQQVEPNDLNSSDLWDKGIMDENDPMPPAGSPQLTQDQINEIAQWINQGAQNNSCQEDCDPTAFSYSQSLAPIIDLYCDGCHGGNNPSGGFTLGTHAQLVNMVQNSNFMDALNGASGTPIMPPQTTGLPDCYKQQFQLWIDAGMPNN